MPARALLIWVLTLLVQFQGTFVWSKGVEKQEGVTLAFVFDSTGSMSDELQQVKDGTQAIFKTMYEHPDKPIYDYALVPFNDPYVGPASVTTDPVSFNNSLKAITVNGGGDCPELAMQGIKLGVEISRPGSFIYVFTDASAKDHHLKKEVEDLIQRKHTQVVFVLTGDCSGHSDPGYQAYESVATASAGQVFNIKKHEVKKVLDYVNDSVKERNKIILVSVDKPKAGENTFSVPVDATMVVLTVSLSGRDPKISVKDPHGVKQDGDKVLDLPQGLVVKILNPEPGTWVVDTSSSSPHAVRVTSSSEFNFAYGFSTMPTNNMAETSPRPLIGAETAVLIKVTNQTQLSHLTKLRIKDTKGTVLQELTLNPVPGYPDIYTVDKFSPPEKLFILEVHGVDVGGNLLTRSSPTAVSPQPPAPPIIKMPSSATAYMNKPFDVQCHVESLVPFTVSWLKNGRGYGSEESFKQSSEVLLHIPNVAEDSGAKYTCKAKNVAGSSSEDTQLTVTAPPPEVDTPDKTIIKPGKKEEIACVVKSDLPYTVTWFKVPESGSPFEITGPRYDVKATGALVIDPVQNSDEGVYRCTAESKVGKGEDDMTVEVREPVKVTVAPKKVNFKRGNSVSLSCSVTGSPEIHLRWKKDGRLIEKGDPRLQKSSKDSLNLQLKNIDRTAEGKYECEANNDVDKDVDMADLMYEESPTATIHEDSKQVQRGSRVIIDCITTGAPKPDVTWSLNGKKISLSSEFKVMENGSLMILSASESGDYKCSAKNTVGDAEDMVTLDIGAIPKFVLEPVDHDVVILSNDSIPCQMEGDPKPSVSWWLKDGRRMDSDRFNYDGDTCTLEIHDAETEDEGVYVVRLTNRFGIKEKEVKITVIGLESPVLDKSKDPNVNAITSEFSELSCDVLEGYPPPIITWYKDGEVLDEVINGVRMEANGSLIIPYVTLRNEGDYECEASNIAGKDKRNMKLIVQEPPVFSRPKRSLKKVNKGKDVQLPCEVQGKPKPFVSWTKDGASLTASSHYGRSSRSDNLLIKRVRESDNSTYECIATNSAGTRKKIIDLLVQDHPNIARHEEEVSVAEDEEVSLECEVTAFPPAEVKWERNGVPLSTDDVTFSEDNSSISFTAKKADAGQYECIATNIAGEDRFIRNVTVMVPPVFEVKEEIVVVNQGQDITLVCYTDAIPPAEYSWTSASGQYLDINDIFSSTLTLHDARPSTSGAYICEAANYVGSSRKVFYVKVNVPPKIHDTFPEEENLIAGGDYDLPCSAEGSPLPKISWKKDGKTFSSPHSDEESVLSIRGATRDDSGLYSCIAVNSEGIDHRTLTLNVLVKPVMEDTEVPVIEAVEGAKTLIIACPAIEANPPPTINWYKDGRFLDTKDKASRQSTRDGGRSLKIKRVTDKDEGEYICVALNEAGRTRADITVKVLKRPKFETATPPLKITVVEGTNILLDCASTGIPAPEVSWSRKGHPLVDSLIPGLVRSPDDQILQIPSVSSEDSGDYQCVVKNKIGRIERKFEIDVYLPITELEGLGDSSEVSEWSSWGPWSPCSASCGESEMVRTRRCLSKGCTGNREEWRRCYVGKCQVDGGWSKWSPWTTCSVTCGVGQRKRSRDCNNPSPRFGGALCGGTKEQSETCSRTPCPINGAWSEWSDWETCNGPCSNSTQRRTRQCSEPSPAFGGADCEGERVQHIPCTLKGCPVDGQWSDWSSWSDCSASCGPSTRNRTRTCTEPEPQYGGAPCVGESVEVKKCRTDPCDNIPLQAAIQIQGTVNGQTFSDTIHHVRISDRDSKRTVELSTKHIPKYKPGWFPYLQYFVSPLVWSTAFQKDGAENGHTLTLGHFRQTMHITFDSGEKLVLKHTGKGVGSDGVQQLQLEVEGDIPLLPEESTTIVEPYEEDYIQVGPGELFAASSGTIEASGLITTYTWNKTITYDSGYQMPFLVETLSAWGIKDKFKPSSSKISHTVSATIGKKIGSELCPEGFISTPENSFCQDIDECADPRLNNCHVTQLCENHAGSYHCVCPLGFHAVTPGSACQDIDECFEKPDLCSHQCVNTEGGFKCFCPPGLILLDDNVTCSAFYIESLRRKWDPEGDSDELVDERITCPAGFQEVGGICLEKNPCEDSPILCSKDEICINIHGFYQCLDAECPDGYLRDPFTKNCITSCSERSSECESGAKLTDTVKYVVVTPEVKSIPAYKDITVLPVRDERNRLRPHTSFRVKENEAGKPFRVKLERGEGMLYSINLLPAGKNYRAVVQAFSFDDDEKNILHSTTFIILVKLSDEITSIR